jgi:beta-glucanase (GH16 family)
MAQMRSHRSLFRSFRTGCVGADWRQVNGSWLFAVLVASTILLAFDTSLATEPAPSGAALDLGDFRLTFDEQFTNFSISPRGPDTRWIAHTPWNGDFGDAQFSDPGPDFPFTVSNGVLRIEARQGDDGRWRSGLICSRNEDGPKGRGFAQKYGYFEMRAKFPDGPGVWPAFWLIGVDKTPSSTEIDVVEQYGQFPDKYNIGLQVRDPGGKITYASGYTVVVPEGIMSTQFNDYGVLIRPDTTSFYFNRREVFKTPTRPEMRQPMYILADLALGGGWPIDKTKNPSVMEISHIQAYTERSDLSGNSQQ